MYEEIIKALLAIFALGYVLYILRYRRDFKISQGLLFSILLASFSTTLLLSTVTKPVNGLSYSLSLGYVGLVFFALSFGELGGIAAGMGAGVGRYLLSGSLNDLGVSFIACVTGGFLAGKIAKRDSSFSNLILGSVLGIMAVLSIHYTYLALIIGTSLGEIYTQTAPLLASATTGVLFGTGLAALIKKWEKWPEPIERS